MIRIRKFRPADTYSAAKLLVGTYAQFNSDDGSPQAVAEYLKHYDPDGDIDNMRRRFMRPHFFFVATDGDELIGMLRGINNRLVNLFVRGDRHRQGIGTKLLARYENQCLRQGHKEIKTRASLFAVPFYAARGYRKTTGVRCISELRIQPMKKLLP